MLHVRPDLADEWNYEKNGNVTPEKVCVNSGKIVYWKCAYGHSWKVSPNSRYSSRTGCPECSSDTRTSFPEQAILFYCKDIFENVQSRYKLNNGQEIDIFIPKERIGIEYDGIFYHSSSEAKSREKRKNTFCKENNIKLYHVCECYESRESRDCYLYRNLKDKNGLDSVIKQLLSQIWCGECDIDTERDYFLIMTQYKSSRDKMKISDDNNIYSEWDYEKNDTTPDMYTEHSGYSAWWKCSLGHGWRTSIHKRVDGQNCPYCAGKKVLEGFNDLMSTFPQIAEEWNYEKNTNLKPNNVMKGTNKTVWWICKQGHEWAEVINTRTRYNRGCPICRKKDALNSRR